MNRKPGWPLFTLVLMLQFACDQPPEIRQYRVEKSRSDLAKLGSGRPDAASSTAASSISDSQPVPSRMVVAIAERDDATWFFKLTGPIAAVDALQTDWTALLSAISFGDDGSPDWGEADQWEVGPAKPMRTATLLRDVEGKGQVELSISSLGPKQDLLLNVNRWMGQLGNPALQPDELELSTLKAVDVELKLFDATGELATGSGMGMQMQMPGSVGSTAVPAAAVEPEMKFDLPDGWTKGATNSIVQIRIRKGDEETSPQITVTQLLAAANDWVTNAQRWARQAEMDDAEPAITKLSSKVSVDGLKGDKIRLIPDDESKPYGIVGVMVVRDELAWFFKFVGDREQIIACEDDFEAFLNSFQFAEAK